MKIHRTFGAALLLFYTTSSAAAGNEVRRLGASDGINNEYYFAAARETDQTKRLPRQLATSLEVAGEDGSPSSAYPLQKCQGDCDDDSDCESTS